MFRITLISFNIKTEQQPLPLLYSEIMHQLLQNVPPKMASDSSPLAAENYKNSIKLKA